MNAGKSLQLLAVANNYDERKRPVVLYTAEIDDRYERGYVTSRLGPRRQAETFSVDTDLFSEIAMHCKVDTPEQKPACILVDESQFLTANQVKQLHRAAHYMDVPVICYGIRTDFRGEPFPGAAYLLALADDIEELKTVCGCNKKATMNVRVDENGERVLDGDQVEIGGNARYTTVCGSCFYGVTRGAYADAA
jgi:thymidine kinase